MGWPELIGVALYLIFGGVMLIVHDNYHWIILGYAILVVGIGLVARLWRAIRLRREIIAFRGLDPRGRAEFLRTLWPSGLRYEYERHLDVDEAHEVEGTAERFPFPRAERRLHARLFWVAACLGGLPAAIALGWPALPLSIRSALLIVGAGAGAAAAWLAGRMTLLSSRLEVTPFSVGVIWPGGRRVSLPFNQPLLLRNVPRKGYYEVATEDRLARVRIHHARLASLRALALVVDRGGFQAVQAAAGEGAT